MSDAPFSWSPFTPAPAPALTPSCPDTDRLAPPACPARQVPWRKIEAQRHNKDRSPAEHARRVAALLRRDRRRAAKIAAAGIEYEYEGLAAALPAKATKITFVD